MVLPVHLPCDGCGQLADSQHFSRRLHRLECATRFRPLHIQTLLLGAIVPATEDEFLYTASSSFGGEARVILEAAQISTKGKSPESVLAEFQKLGLALAHVLECPLEPSTPAADAPRLLESQLPAAIARIRRSLKPKRVLLVSPDLTSMADTLRRADLGCPILPSSGTFFLNWHPTEEELTALRMALAGANSHVV
jgi:hypothetical protein